MEVDGKLIQITHFTNPSRFFFRDLSTFEAQASLIDEIEEQIIEEATRFRNKNGIQRFFAPTQGQVVGYFSKNNQRWLRCKVDEFNTFSEIPIAILWSMDFGFPLHTTRLDELVPLSPVLADYRTYIEVGGISMVPVTTFFDHVNCQPQKVVSKRWNERAVNIFKTLDKNYKKVLFIPSENSHPSATIGDLFFGEHKIDLGMKLEVADVAIHVDKEEFKKHYDSLITNHIQRWNDNNQSGGVLKLKEGVNYCLKIFNPFTLQEEVPEPPLLDESSVFDKVLEWQKRNEADSFFEPDPPMYPTPGYCESPMIVDCAKGPVSAQKLREKLENLPEAQKVKRLKPTRLNFEQAESEKQDPDHLSVDTSFDFVSASQVGSLVSGSAVQARPVSAIMQMLKKYKI